MKYPTPDTETIPETAVSGGPEPLLERDITVEDLLALLGYDGKDGSGRARDTSESPRSRPVRYLGRSWAYRAATGRSPRRCRRQLRWFG